MTRLRLAAVSVLLGLAAGALAGAGLASTAAGPFYLVPSPTKECLNVKHCAGVTGPWIEVPARGQATYLFGCPDRQGFVIGGTDARASSRDVRVWFDGKLGAPIGSPPSTTRGRAVLVFHAAANSGRHGWFQPILGCVPLRQKTKRSTVAAVPGTAPGAPLDLRSEQVLLLLYKGTRQTTALACGRGERLVGNWHAFALGSRTPPTTAYTGAVRITTVSEGNRVRAAFEIVKPRLFGPLAPRAWVQVGAMCQP